MKNKKRIAAMVMTGLILCSFLSTIAETEEKGIEITYNGVPIEEAIGTASGMFADAVEENMSEMIDGLNDVFSEFAQVFSESLGEIEDALQPQASTAESDIAFDYFCYSNSGSSTYEIYSYEVGRDEETGEWTVICELHCGYDTYTLPADAELMNKLTEIMDAHTLRQWDGFSASDSMVLDGSGFSLEVDFEDGSAVYAQGSNSFPDGFNEAKQAIDGLFRTYLEKNGITPEGGF